MGRGWRSQAMPVVDGRPLALASARTGVASGGSPPGVAGRLEPIARASAEIRAAHRAAGDGRRAALAWRRCLLAIDRCLERLEEAHAATGVTAPAGLGRGLLAELEATTGLHPPAAVRRARDSYRLHDALLTWQSEVLDALVPERSVQYPDLDREPDQGDRPLQRRRPAGAASAARGRFAGG